MVLEVRREIFPQQHVRRNGRAFVSIYYNGPSITVATVFHLASENGWTGGAFIDLPVAAVNLAKDALVSESATETSQKASYRRDAMINAADLRTMTFQPVRYVLYLDLFPRG